MMDTYTTGRVVLNTLKFDKNLAADIDGLYAQLTQRNAGGVAAILKEAKVLNNFKMFGVWYDTGNRNQLVAMVTLALVTDGIETFGQVHNLVTDGAHRGKQHGRSISLAEEIMQLLIAFAKERKLSFLQLTSKTERVAANKLYDKLGFQFLAQAAGYRGTNLYRLYLQNK